MFNRIRTSCWEWTAERILRKAKQLEQCSSDRLERDRAELGGAVRRRQPVSSIIGEVFALGIETTRRVLGKRHYPVQVMGAIALARGFVAEMQTGEGKTLTAVLPTLLHALAGKGCHVLTANEYLARRDAAEMARIFAELGLTTGCVLDDMDDDARRTAYACDITYGTAAQIGFDFLRDRLKRGPHPDEAAPKGAAGGWRESRVQRGLHMALIDEIDSVLIDEAKTPLIIGIEDRDRPEIESLYRWADHCARTFDPAEDFQVDPRTRQVDLTDLGSRKVTLLSKPLALDQIDSETICLHVERALTAHRVFHRDRDYVVREEEIAIVDEGTGRIMEGRKWQDGLHQAIEVKERAPLSAQTGCAARITVQSLFRRYEHLAGMTGTAGPARREFRSVYRLPVVRIPTHRRCLRFGLPPRVFPTLRAKWEAVAESTLQGIATGRAVLIGTPSVEASQGLSRILAEAGVEHEVLNAIRHAEEAPIVARAGEAGRVTVATNMAGRGTDILLAESVRRAGGLHVIATELHSSARIDRQLVGRAGRQGDPGSFQFFLSLEDELLRTLPPSRLARLRKGGQASGSSELAPEWARLFETAQRRIEIGQSRQRRQLLTTERQRAQRYHYLRLDPFLELTE
ncbi:DEAD/DEAH box helicase [Planctomyces sp. SH-PL14]|uniref:preprotein translocase subunit SecA n=1 Tax=Planctomyces sp. SH-PL14 TaxID=1632864 RepID=UPI00078E578F|nr:DEAD/DEAH box helicase [Planctomyces sp. SH-PL14]AMV18027.1 preprotein translocase subunit SecA [Planctomyces sp. SH-PL14]